MTTMFRGIRLYMLASVLLLRVAPSVAEDLPFDLPPSFLQEESADEAAPAYDYNLLDAVTIPFRDSRTQYVDESEDGFAAFGFRAGADVKMALKQILPHPIDEEFSILVSAKPVTRNGGFVFAIVNAMETVVQLGIKISSETGPTTNIALYHTDSVTEVTSRVVANFTVPKFSNRWTKFAFKVSNDDVTLFFNCSKTATVETRRIPVSFDSASTLYLAQAGPRIGGVFEGALAYLKIFRDPLRAEEQCKTEFQGFIDSQDEESLNNTIALDNDEINEDYDISNDINSYVERTDYPPYRKEDSHHDGSEMEGGGLGTFPPPPPAPPDVGKTCPPCGASPDNCCNVFFNNTHAAGKYRGEKGEKGSRGSPGESVRGPPGPPGPPGLPGAEAPEAKCSCNITSIISSLGKSLPYSPAASSLPGREGLPGLPGEQGRPGEKGAMGTRGDKGERGERGPPGPQGTRGEQGKDGSPGPPGPPGPAGPPGPTEIDMGVNGNDRNKGASGVPIIRPGIPGSKGEPGQPGELGLKGERGAVGAKGPPGAKGERGDRGLPGEKGGQGSKGDTGIDGFPGTPGTPGQKGDVGPPGNPGVVSANGTAVFNCPPGPPGLDGKPGEKGSQGDKGARGPQGPQGPSGDKGSPGLDGPLGPVGPPGTKGDRGERGLPGEVFIHKGEDGEDVITLKGEKGDIGRRGRRGKQGPQGPPGPPGKIGDIGLPGWQGRSGHPGPKGEKGDSWIGDATALKGDKGDKGDPGKDGIPGRDSETRFVPVPGPPGPPGPPGHPGLSITGPKGEPGESIFSEPLYNMRPGRSTDSPPIAHAVIQQKETAAPPMAGAAAFRTRRTMMEAMRHSPIGTMVYIIDEEALVIRVNAGWQYVALGSLLHPEPPQHIATTTAPPQVNPPFESSNLVNHNLPKAPERGEIPHLVSNPTQEVPNVIGRVGGEVKSTQFASLRLAALNDPYTGNSGGIRGSDYACYREAHRAGLKGTFRAFLSSRGQDVKSIVRQVDRVLPVTNLRGEVLFDSWMEMFDGDMATFAHQPRIFSFNGKNVMVDQHWPVKAVWHGALADGTRELDISCDAWQSNMSDKHGLAGDLKAKTLLDQNRISCDRKLILLCIEATSEIFVRRRRRRDLEDDGIADNSAVDLEENSDNIVSDF